LFLLMATWWSHSFGMSRRRGSRGAGEQGSRGAGEQGSRGAGEQGRPFPYHNSIAQASFLPCSLSPLPLSGMGVASSTAVAKMVNLERLDYHDVQVVSIALAAPCGSLGSSCDTRRKVE
jgi:hypothetical protein